MMKKIVTRLPKEKVKCRACGKEGEINPDELEIGQGFRIHFEGDEEYFLCLDCEVKFEKENCPDYPEEEGNHPW